MTFRPFLHIRKILFRMAFVLTVVGACFGGLAVAGGSSCGSSSSDCDDCRTVQAQTREITNFHQAVGSIGPWYEPVLSSQVRARIKEIPVRPGEEVEPGQVMVKLEDREFRSRLAQAEKELEAVTASLDRIQQEIAEAQARLEEVRADFQRRQELHVRGAVTDQELDRARSAFSQARAAHEQALVRLREARANREGLQARVSELETVLEHTRIRAPVRAQVVKRMVDPGDIADPGKPLLRIQTRHLLRMEALVPERLMSGIELGDRFDVRVDALDLVLEGEVREIDPAAHPAGRNFMVKLGIDRDDPRLYPGMFARVRLPVDKEEMLLIPQDSVRRIGQLPTVQLLREEEVRSRHVRLGREINGYVEVLSGLEPGDRIKLEP